MITADNARVGELPKCRKATGTTGYTPTELGIIERVAEALRGPMGIISYNPTFSQRKHLNGGKAALRGLKKVGATKHQFKERQQNAPAALRLPAISFWPTLVPRRSRWRTKRT